MLKTARAGCEGGRDDAEAESVHQFSVFCLMKVCSLPPALLAPSHGTSQELSKKLFFVILKVILFKKLFFLSFSQPRIGHPCAFCPALCSPLPQGLASDQGGPAVHSRQNKTFADKHRTMGPSNQLNQEVCLSICGIHLKNTPRKLGPRFIGLYCIDKIINSSAVRLKLPAFFRIHPTCHVSQVNLVSLSPLCPPPLPT